MRTKLFINSIFTFIVFLNVASAQDCRVVSDRPVEKYEGECIEGLANGMGRCYYNDSNFYTGKFENGFREGKGEFHFHRDNQSDSIVKGYWSGNMFTGKRYQPYVLHTERVLSDCEFSFVGKKQKRLTVRIGLTKRGNPNANMVSQYSQPLPKVISLEISDSKKNVILLSRSDDQLKSEYVYEIETYPVKLNMRLSDGKKMEFELNKPGEWLLEGYLYSRIEERTVTRPRY